MQCSTALWLALCSCCINKLISSQAYNDWDCRFAPGDPARAAVIASSTANKGAPFGRGALGHNSEHTFWLGNFLFLLSVELSGLFYLVAGEQRCEECRCFRSSLFNSSSRYMTEVLRARVPRRMIAQFIMHIHWNLPRNTMDAMSIDASRRLSFSCGSQTYGMIAILTTTASI